MTETVRVHAHPHISLHVFGDGVQLDHATIVTHDIATGSETVEYYEDVREAKVRFNVYTGEQVW